MALNLAPFSRWTLRDKAAQRRLALLHGLPLQSSNADVIKPGTDHVFQLHYSIVHRKPWSEPEVSPHIS